MKLLKHITGALICLIIISPLLPFALIQILAQWTDEFINWCFEGRWLLRKIDTVCEWVYSKMGMYK